MFHPERLTGNRRRKYEASVSYAPQAEKIPKHLLEKIRAPAHHVKYVLRLMPDAMGTRTAHYVAVIRQRVVALNHDAEAMSGEKAMAELSGKKWQDARCQCYRVCEMYATHTSTDRVMRGKKRLAHASAKADLREDMIKLRLTCRRPRKEYRGLFVNSSGGRGDFERFNGDVHLRAAKRIAYVDARLNAGDFQRKISVRAAEILRAAVGGGIVQVQIPSSDSGAGTTQLNVRKDAFAPSWAVYLDPYAWYTRIYARGIAVMGDWFLTHITRGTYGGTIDPIANSQMGVALVSREYDKTLADLNVVQIAAAVNTKWLARHCPFASGRPIDVVTGVVARPFPGGEWFMPFPGGAGALAWNPRSGNYSDQYDIKLSHELPEPPDMAKLREIEAAERLARLHGREAEEVVITFDSSYEIFNTDVDL